MDSERWKRIEEVYHSILASPVENRSAVLEERCTGDAELRREVESLLEARDEAGAFLEGSAGGQVEELAAPAAGSTLGHYQILARIGAGAMGEVYRAHDTLLDRQVALKVLPTHFTHNAERVSRFHLEAKAASGLNHPNIVTIYEIGQAGGTWFIAQELIEGANVRERLAGGSVPLEEAAGWGMQCAAALGAAHRAGIIHRDIKPENIMVRPDGMVKVVDFGLARISEGSGGWAPQATLTGSVMGTPRYMSPEQARGQKLDARTDIFSLGAVLYEMIAARPAFAGASTAEVFAALLGSEPAETGGLADAVLSKALAKDPAARYQTMEELAGDLRTLDFQQPAAAKTKGVPLRKRYAAIALVLAAGLALLWFRPAAVREGARDAPLSLTPLTAFEGPKDFAAFSPDGNRIAFSWNGGKAGAPERHIYIKDVAAAEPVQLTSAAQDDSWPAWSPDGSRIAFLRRISRLERAVFLVPASGGAERKVAEAWEGVSWSPDGKWLALADPRGPNGFGGLQLLSLETGERRDLTASGSAGDSSPVYSPDGQWIAFLRSTPNSDIFVLPATGGPRQLPRRLTFDAKPKLGGLTWTPDSREVVYSTQREYGGEGLWRVPLSGGGPRRISSTLLFAGNPSISRKGNRLAYTESWIDTNIYRADGPGFDASGVPGPFGEPVKLIASSREDHSPSFSPDGERIAFVSNRTGHSEIWTSRRDGSGQVQLTRFESFAGTPRWSPDGRWIAFDCILGGNADIYVIGAGGGEPRRLTTDPAPDTKPSWSPDGAWIYFNSDRSGSPQVWKMTAEGGAATQVTKKGGREVLPSADGRAVYYTKHGGGAPVWWVPSEGGQEQPLQGMGAFDQVGRAWGVVREGIYFVSPEKGSVRDAIRFFSFGTGGVTEMGGWPERTAWTGPAMALSPDGRSLLTVRKDQELNDLMMIENFR